MNPIERRAFLGFLLGGAALAAAGASLTSTAVVAAPFPVDTASSSLIDSPLEGRLFAQPAGGIGVGASAGACVAFAGGVADVESALGASWHTQPCGPRVAL